MKKRKNKGYIRKEEREKVEEENRQAHRKIIFGDDPDETI